MTAPTAADPGANRLRTLKLSLLAFLLGFIAVGGVAMNMRFLWNAYLHGGL